MNSNQGLSTHYYELAHTSAFTPLNKAYSLKFALFNGHKNINLPSQVAARFCPNCGQLNVPGVTTSTRVSFRSTRLLVTLCLSCGNVHRVRLTPDRGSSITKSNPIGAIDKPKPLTVSKKRRKNDLSTLLKRKKETKEEKSLDLMEFMKS